MKFGSWSFYWIGYIFQFQLKSGTKTDILYHKLNVLLASEGYVEP